MIFEVSLIPWEGVFKKVDEESLDRSLLCGRWFFGIVQQICKAEPGHDVACVIAVPHQHIAFEHFDQTGAAVHPALSSHCAKFV